MLKKSASGVLALLRGFTYRTEYASPLRVLRPCWTNFLSILREYISVAPAERTVEILVRQHCFPVAYYLMNLRIDHAQSDDAPIIAQMVGELLREITAMVGTSVSGFHEEETETRARSWMADGKYSILLARDGVQPESLGFLALYESFALYTEGAFGTIPEFYVRRAYRSQGVGTLLLSEAKRIGQSKGWRRLEVTTPPLPQFDGTLTFYQREGFSISGGRKLKLELS